MTTSAGGKKAGAAVFKRLKCHYGGRSGWEMSFWSSPTEPAALSNGGGGGGGSSCLPLMKERPAAPSLGNLLASPDLWAAETPLMPRHGVWYFGSVTLAFPRLRAAVMSVRI